MSNPDYCCSAVNHRTSLQALLSVIERVQMVMNRRVEDALEVMQMEGEEAAGIALLITAYRDLGRVEEYTRPPSSNTIHHHY